MMQLKHKSEIEKMAEAGRIVAQVLERLGQMVRPGISTGELDQTATKIIRQAQAVPSFLGYGQPPYPASICASIDDEVVHGIPDTQRILLEGSIISVDVGVYLNGYHADAARTFPVGVISPQLQKLIDTAEKCFWNAFQLAESGARIGDLSFAVQHHAEQNGYGVVRELTGHGIGHQLHEEPDLPNFGRQGHGQRLEPGLVLAMEPMINMGTRRISLKSDGWTIVTADGQPSAHYENTFAVTEDGPIILTAR